MLNKADLVSREFAKRQCEVYNGVAVSAINPATLMPLIEVMQDIIAPYVVGSGSVEMKNVQGEEVGATSINRF